MTLNTASSPSELSSVFAPIEDIVAEISKGRMIVLVDDEDRENEGDLVVAAEFAVSTR